MPAPRYTIDLLNKMVTESDGATLQESYDSCNAATVIRFTCKCGESGEKKMRSIVEKAGLTCAKCALRIRNETYKQTCLDRYGVTHTNNLPEVKAKRDATNLERYGTTEPLMTQEIREKVKQTNLQKYGVTCTIHAPAIKEKVKATNLARYGVEHSFQSEIVKGKTKETNLKRYGVEHASAAQVVKDKVVKTNLQKRGVKHSLQSPEVREKVYATNMKRYGVKVARQAPLINEKVKQTCLKKYGEDSPLKVPIIRQKAKDTTKAHYGVEYAVLSPEIKAKIRESNLQKYGVPFTCQATEVIAKIQKNAKRFKEFKMPSGAVRRVQGYEPFALTDLLQKGYTEEQIVTGRIGIPRIQYTADNKTRYHFPDIFIPHENRIIEVKSTWTYACKEDNVHLKKSASEAAGYQYEIWCYNHEGKRIDI